MKSAVATPGELLATGPLLSRHEVAELLGVSPSTVWRLVRSGDLRACRVGSQLRLAPHDVESYLRETRTGAPSGARTPIEKERP